MPRKMNYYENENTFRKSNNIKNEKNLLLYKKILREDGYVKILVPSDVISLPFNKIFNYPSSYLKFKSKEKSPIYKNDSLKITKVLVKNSVKAVCDKKSDIITKGTILTGALSFGLNIFCIVGIIAAADRGYTGAVGGEIFLALSTIYIMFKLLECAQLKDNSKS